MTPGHLCVGICCGFRSRLQNMQAIEGVDAWIDEMLVDG